MAPVTHLAGSGLSLPVPASADTGGARVPLQAIPSLAVTAEGLRFLPLDAKAAYLLSLVDGRNSFATILDVCDIVREDAFEVLVSLLQAGAIEVPTESGSAK